MSTRSMIALVNDDDTGKQVYCHCDGYLEWNGYMLHEHYDTPAKVDKIMRMGNVSSLRSTIKETVFFTRDMGRYWKQDTFTKFELTPVDNFILALTAKPLDYDKILLPLLTDNRHTDAELYYVFYKSLGWLVASIPVKPEHYPQVTWAVLSEALRGKQNYTIDPINHD